MIVKPWNRRATLIAGLAGLLMSMSGCRSDGPRRSAPPADEGDRAFGAGRLPDAERAYTRALGEDPGNLRAMVGAGLLALSRNRLAEATTKLRAAVDRAPRDGRALQGLAETAYRQDDFRGSAGWLRRWAAIAGRDERARLQPVLRKLEGFGGATPYRIDPGDSDVRVPFVVTDPLPVVNVGLAGGRTEPFFLDTGGHEVYLDEGLAGELDLPSYGTVAALGAGGKTGRQGQARLDLLRLGDLEVRDLPVATQDFGAMGYAQALGGVPVKGVLGTAFLSHFLAAIDYRGGALLLRPRSADRLRSYERQPHRAVVPFRLVGTHAIIAEGTVGDSAPALLFVDTGGAGVGFAGTTAGMRRAGIPLPTGAKVTGPGAGGTAEAVPFTVPSITLGKVEGRELPGVYFPEGDFDEAIPAYTRVPFAGIVSHQFFRPYSLTMDFARMRLFID
jgi:predicted aspartyl protease